MNWKRIFKPSLLKVAISLLLVFVFAPVLGYMNYFVCSDAECLSKSLSSPLKAMTDCIFLGSGGIECTTKSFMSVFSYLIRKDKPAIIEFSFLNLFIYFIPSYLSAIAAVSEEFRDKFWVKIIHAMDKSTKEKSKSGNKK